MNGKLIVIEGLDGSGKSTQEALLRARLEREGQAVTCIKLPNYDDPACALVKMYLAGRFGSDPAAVNAYAASSFYAVDRYVSYHCGWKPAYLAGGCILADRYTTSNAYHQLTKTPRAEWDAYLAWLEDFEYGKLGIPRPDAVIYLDMPIDVSQRLMTGRYQGDEGKKDIHEKNTAYLRACAEAAAYAADRLGWVRISCAEGDAPREREAIADEVYAAVRAAMDA